MRFRKLLAAVLFTLPFAVACGTDCYDLCEDKLDERCTDFDHDACVHTCVMQEDFSEVSDECDSEAEKLVECVSDLDNVCDSVVDPDEPHGDEKCHDEADDYSRCLARYCEDHENRDWCEPLPLDPHP